METRQPDRLTRPLLIAAIAAALVLGLLIGVAAGSPTALRRARPEDDRHVEPGIDARAEPADRVRRALRVGDQLAPEPARLFGRAHADPARRRALRSRSCRSSSRDDVRWDAGSKTLSVRAPDIEIAGPRGRSGRAAREYGEGGVLAALTGGEEQLDQANRARGGRRLAQAGDGRGADAAGARCGAAGDRAQLRDAAAGRRVRRRQGGRAVRVRGRGPTPPISTSRAPIMRCWRSARQRAAQGSTMTAQPHSLKGVDLLAEIARLKKERNAVILAHYYQKPEIQDLADFVGDSLDLSRKAAATDAEVIAFCGVRFMAETAKILSPDKTVILPDMDAGCSLEDSCPPDQFKAFREAHPDHIALTYINCSAAVKALSATSSSPRAQRRHHPQADPDGPEDHLRPRPAPRRLSRAADRPRHAAVAGRVHRPPGVFARPSCSSSRPSIPARRSPRTPNARRTSSTMPTMSARPARSSSSR